MVTLQFLLLCCYLNHEFYFFCRSFHDNWFFLTSQWPLCCLFFLCLFRNWNWLWPFVQTKVTSQTCMGALDRQLWYTRKKKLGKNVVFATTHMSMTHAYVWLCICNWVMLCWANWAHFVLHCCSPVGFPMNCEYSEVGFFIGSSATFVRVSKFSELAKSADLSRVWGWTSQISHRKNTPSPEDTSLFYQLQPQEQTS